MNEHDEPIDQQFADGTVAREIEHMLCLYLHELNTISDIETLKSRIEQLIHSAYLDGVARQFRQAKDEIERKNSRPAYRHLDTLGSLWYTLQVYFY